MNILPKKYNYVHKMLSIFSLNMLLIMLHPCSSLFILLHILNMTYIIAYTRGIMYGYFLTDTLLYFFSGLFFI